MSCTNCGSSPSTRKEYNTVHEYSPAGHGHSSDVPTKVTKWTALPLYTSAALPDDIDVIAGSNEEGKAWRLPLSRILAGGDLNRLQYSIKKKTSTVEIPRGQVVPVYIPGPDLPLEAAVASDMATRAHFLAVAVDPNDPEGLIMQGSGFITFPRVHSYQVGKTYFTHQSNHGEVTSVRPVAGIVQPLFTVVDELTIFINIGV